MKNEILTKVVFQEEFDFLKSIKTSITKNVDVIVKKGKDGKLNIYENRMKKVN